MITDCLGRWDLAYDQNGLMREASPTTVQCKLIDYIHQDSLSEMTIRKLYSLKIECADDGRVRSISLSLRTTTHDPRGVDCTCRAHKLRFPSDYRAASEERTKHTACFLISPVFPPAHVPHFAAFTLGPSSSISSRTGTAKHLIKHQVAIALASSHCDQQLAANALQPASK